MFGKRLGKLGVVRTPSGLSPAPPGDGLAIDDGSVELTTDDGTTVLLQD